MIVSFRFRRIVSLVGAALALAATSASAQSVYVESRGTGAGGRFGILDLATGGYQLLGTRAAVSLSGLALSSGGILYGSTESNQLYTVNLADGQLTLRGNLAVGSNRITGITFASDGNLYGLLSGTTGSPAGGASLIRINNLAGVPTITSLGSLGFFGNGGIAGDASGNLFATEGNLPPSGFGSLFRFGTSGGTATSLSPDADALFNAPVYALGFSASTLFAVDNGADPSGGGTVEGGIYQVDRATGIATPSASYNPGVVGNVFAIAGGVVVPEPGTFALMLPALGLLAAFPLAKRKGTRRRTGGKGSM